MDKDTIVEYVNVKHGVTWQTVLDEGGNSELMLVEQTSSTSGTTLYDLIYVTSVEGYLRNDNGGVIYPHKIVSINSKYYVY